MNVMKLENAENSPSEKTKLDDTPVESESELNELYWAVVSFERCVASSLTYEQAAGKLAELAAEKVSGLCVITDEAAKRVKH